ncbi:PIN domain-containing protein [Paenibacillus glucanolyticus]|uniref:5'-3' exonuclease n=1 Tax=Paenibacillus glucanolyticus TaxID=59843 RepID=A0A163GHH8_9BACL|nr:PIN domain-containing protein [Paenibacillus glucanolyticus]KZS44976.1 hypothetical protein AWU65_03070 [Paenibacillus glucanolyticus]OMF64811.1 hypothetical protein BK142_31440 [Paenibacillus glucanolyticus]
MKLRAKMPVKATEKSLRVCLESVYRQWKSRAGEVRKAELTDDGWFEILIGPNLHPQEFGYIEPAKNPISQEGNIFQVSIIGSTSEKLKAIFQELSMKIIEHEVESGYISEVLLCSGEGIQFQLVEADWQPMQSGMNHLTQVGSQAAVPLSENEIKLTSTDRSTVTPPTMSSSLLIIDAMNLLARCYWATAYSKEEHELMKSSKGKFTNAIKPLTEKLVKMIRRFAPTHIAVVWDPPGGRSTLWRRRLADFYKANRDNKEDPVPFKEQIETAKSVFRAMNIQQFHVDTMEADDLAGSLSKRWSTEINGNCLLWSNDKDYF